MKNLSDTNSELVGGEHVAIERSLNDNHLRACLYAGLKMHGANREASPSEVCLNRTNIFKTTSANTFCISLREGLNNHAHLSIIVRRFVPQLATAFRNVYWNYRFIL